MILYRNDAAHGGEIDNFLSVPLLLEMCDFVGTLCMALLELVTSYVLRSYMKVGKAETIGELTKWYKKPEAGVGLIKSTKVSVYEKVYLLNADLFYCCSTEIKSLAVDNVFMASVEVSDADEVGFKFNVTARKNLYIIRLHTA